MSKVKTEAGFFNLEVDPLKIMELNLRDGKEYCLTRVKEFQDAHPGTNPKNVVKAERMIFSAKNPVALATGIYDFGLAHTSENLAVIK